MIRIAAEVVNEERVPWTVQRYMSQSEIAKTRRTIKTYTRDLSYNILIAVVLVVIYFTITYASVLH